MVQAEAAKASVAEHVSVMRSTAQCGAGLAGLRGDATVLSSPLHDAQAARPISFHREGTESLTTFALELVSQVQPGLVAPGFERGSAWAPRRNVGLADPRVDEQPADAARIIAEAAGIADYHGASHGEADRACRIGSDGRGGAEGDGHRERTSRANEEVGQRLPHELVAMSKAELSVSQSCLLRPCMRHGPRRQDAVCWGLAHATDLSLKNALGDQLPVAFVACSSCDEADEGRRSKWRMLQLIVVNTG
jgi:hypothetical protein